MAQGSDIGDQPRPSIATDATQVASEGDEAPAAREPVARPFGKYTLVRELGEGGMGVVYEAYDPDLDRLIALKLLHPRFRGSSLETLRVRLLREARAMARLSHPHVTAVYESGAVGEQLYIAMELVRGTTLKAWAGESPRRWREILGLYLQAGDGLAAAHREGLVHRDFKPANVLVGTDGRARVTDFGLARLDDSLADTSAPGLAMPAPGVTLDVTPAGVTPVSGATPARVTPSQTVTRTGQDALGTPAYMAPEQHRAEQVTARSDQFAFCCSLWEALYREHPFGGGSLVELHDNVTAGLRREPTSGRDVPGSVKAALVRGLALRPEDRFADMPALLGQLRRDPGRARRRWTAAGVGLSLAAIAVWATARSVSSPPLCADAAAAMKTAWNDRVASRIGAAFSATGLPFAADSQARAAAGLGAYASGWSRTREAVCRATHEQGVQSAELLDLRMGCLDRRLRRFSLLVAELERADAEVVTAAVTAVASLGRVGECEGDAAALQVAAREPEQADARAAVRRLRDVVDRADVLNRAGRAAEAAALLGPAAAEAQKLGFDPIVAETDIALAGVEEPLGQLDAAERHLREGLSAAARAQDHRRVARAWRELLYLVGYQRARLDEARALEPAAVAAQAQAGADRFDEARLLSVRGSVAQRAGDYARALELGGQALAILEEVAGPTNLETVRLHSNIGNALSRLGRDGEAEGHYRQAIAALEKALGPGHPEVARVRINLGGTLRDLHRDDEARAEYLKALPVLEGAGLKESSAALLNNLGVLERGAGRLEQARAAYEKALAIRIELFGAMHPTVAEIENNLGNMALAAGKLDEAERRYRRTLEIRAAAFGPEHAEVARARWSMARIEEARGRYPEAIAAYEQALALADRTQSDQAWKAVFRVNLALLIYEHAPARRKQAIALAETARDELTALGKTKLAAAADELAAKARRGR